MPIDNTTRMRVSISVKPEVYNRLKDHARKEKKSPTRLVKDALVAYLDNQKMIPSEWTEVLTLFIRQVRKAGTLLDRLVKYGATLERHGYYSGMEEPPDWRSIEKEFYALEDIVRRWDQRMKFLEQEKEKDWIGNLTLEVRDKSGTLIFTKRLNDQ